MKKIPTLFERDWNGDRSRVVDQVHPGCEWVIAGEGVATRKLDGTCCMVRGGKLYKRYELRPGRREPVNFDVCDHDTETGKLFGWVPVGDGPDDQWHREAFGSGGYSDGTYELVGPKVQGNPEGAGVHMLIRHSDTEQFHEAPRTFDGLKGWLATLGNIEGIVFHHSDGRMAKIKLRDFGLKRTQKGAV